MLFDMFFIFVYVFLYLDSDTCSINKNMEEMVYSIDEADFLVENPIPS